MRRLVLFVMVVCFDGDSCIVGLVRSTDQDLLTAVGQNLTSLLQYRVPGLEPGKGWSGSTQAAEVLQESTCSIILRVPNASVRIFFMSVDMESFRANAVCAGLGRLDGSAGLTFAPCVQHPRIICGGRNSGRL